MIHFHRPFYWIEFGVLSELHACKCGIKPQRTSLHIHSLTLIVVASFFCLQSLKIIFFCLLDVLNVIEKGFLYRKKGHVEKLKKKCRRVYSYTVVVNSGRKLSCMAGCLGHWHVTQNIGCVNLHIFFSLFVRTTKMYLVSVTVDVYFWFSLKCGGRISSYLLFFYVLKPSRSLWAEAFYYRSHSPRYMQSNLYSSTPIFFSFSSSSHFRVFTESAKQAVIYFIFVWFILHVISSMFCHFYIGFN